MLSLGGKPRPRLPPNFAVPATNAVRRSGTIPSIPTTTMLQIPSRTIATAHQTRKLSARVMDGLNPGRGGLATLVVLQVIACVQMRTRKLGQRTKRAKETRREENNVAGLPCGIHNGPYPIFRGIAIYPGRGHLCTAQQRRELSAMSASKGSGQLRLEASNTTPRVIGDKMVATLRRHTRCNM